MGPQLVSATVGSGVLVVRPAAMRVAARIASAGQPPLAEFSTEPSPLDRLDPTVGAWAHERAVDPRAPCFFVRAQMRRRGEGPTRP